MSVSVRPTVTVAAGAKTTDKCENPIEALGHLSVDPSIAAFYAAVRNTS